MHWIVREQMYRDLMLITHVKMTLAQRIAREILAKRYRDAFRVSRLYRWIYHNFPRQLHILGPWLAGYRDGRPSWELTGSPTWDISELKETWEMS